MAEAEATSLATIWLPPAARATLDGSLAIAF
jgi:hypothetical protein